MFAVGATLIRIFPDSMGMTDTGLPNRPIKTAVRVFNVIEVVQTLEQASFTEIAAQVEMAESTLHDYLSTLVHIGYLTKADGQYNLSLRFFDHGISARDSFSIYSKSQSTLKRLADESGAAVWLIVEQNGKAVYLAQELGEESIETHERLGKHEYMHYLASGKAMLAFATEEHLEEIVDKHGLPQKTPESISTIEDLRDELTEIREQGYAMNHNESAKGLSAVAAPVIVDDEVVGAIAIAVPATRMENDTRREELIDLVRRGSNQIELELTYG